ncbi:unnamed protein product [Didymodactylos carnosus]|uniref:Uncharacterized protein n=1 Tax=Didymodactylos carnosus TaxID=1234261 RepID=A0A8S2E436_9BILA|nr:unnamed protein product [Didymodactylos carnosus]CAF3818751.1 unnamed protein product [Didymodactylos carnosus]
MALDEIACDFKQVEQTHSNQKQSIQKICDDGIREVEIEIDKAEQRQQEVKKQANNRVSNLLDQYHNMDEHTFLEKFQRDLNKHNTEQNTSGENFVNDDHIQIIARDLFLKIDQRMTAVHFKDFPILFDEFFG